MILRTLDQARDYALSIAVFVRLPVHIFAVPEGTRAHDMGFRFGTFRDDERREWESEGAIVLETVMP
jgi:hypothetical protein